MADLGDKRYSTDEANEMGVPMVLVDPSSGEDVLNNEGKKMTIYLVGTDSRQFSEFQVRNASKYRGKKTPSVGQMKKDQRDLLACCTTRFENIVIDGSTVDYSHKSAMDLYERLPWVKEQVDEFINERANFLGN